MKIENININNIKIESGRVTLRPFEEKDLDDFHAYASASGVGEASGWKHHESKEESEAVLKEIIAGHHVFAIVEQASGKVIGSIGFETSSKVYNDCGIGEDINDIGYIIGCDYWGVGYASDAIIGMVSYAFYELHLDAVTCACFKDNETSKKIIEKIGFECVAEGKYKTQTGEEYEAVYYALTHEKYGVTYREVAEEPAQSEQIAEAPAAPEVEEVAEPEKAE